MTSFGLTDRRRRAEPGDRFGALGTPARRAASWTTRGRARLGRRQPALGLQFLQVDQQRVAGKGGVTLVGRFTIARRPQRTDLPVFDPGRLQKIEKAEMEVSQVVSSLEK